MGRPRQSVFTRAALGGAALSACSVLAPDEKELMGDALRDAVQLDGSSAGATGQSRSDAGYVIVDGSACDRDASCASGCSDGATTSSECACAAGRCERQCM